MYLKPESVGKDKAESRWEDGVYLGVRGESGELIIGTSSGVIKAKTFRRYGRDEDRWNLTRFGEFKGVPWEPIPGRKGYEFYTQVALPKDDRAVMEPQKVATLSSNTCKNNKMIHSEVWQDYWMSCMQECH